MSDYKFKYGSQEIELEDPRKSLVNDKTKTNESKWRELEPAIVYTFEEIIDAQKYPKAYGRKFVVVEKYDELRTQLAAAKDSNDSLERAVNNYKAVIAKLTEEVQRLKDKLHVEELKDREASAAMKEAKLYLDNKKLTEKLRVAVRLLRRRSGHEQDCHDQDEEFSEDETCECGSIEVQQFLAKLESDK